jgi:DNA polymerase-4
MPRTILHVDANAFYVSCEMSENPSLRGKAVVVGGDAEARHGIVLAKSDKAKATGIKTGHVLWQAKQLCPGLIVLPPNFRLYLRMSRELRTIMGDYSGHVEPFGLDEAWVGLGPEPIDEGRRIADEIRRRAWKELGITVSVGVANNKVFAKLGSDYKKPDATTVITPEDYARIVWPLPVGDLLYVGSATKEKLLRVGINTIGKLANAPRDWLTKTLGVNGDMVWRFASGLDTSEVASTGSSPDIKSIGNSTTTPRDLISIDDIRLTVWVLAESVAERLREHGFRAKTIRIYIRDNNLVGFERQTKLNRPTKLADDIARAAMDLFCANYNFLTHNPVRSVGIRGADLVTDDGNIQLSMLIDETRRINQELIEHAVDSIRHRFGHFAIQRASMLDDRIGGINPKDDHIIHPIGWAR